MDFFRRLDDGTVEWCRQFWGSNLDPFMADVTALGGFYVVALVTVFSLGLLLTLRRFPSALFLAAVLGGGVLISRFLKDEVSRSRPAVHHPLLDVFPSLTASQHSFPSGHSMLSAITYLTLALFANAIIPGRRTRAYVLGSGIVLVMLIGVSRVYLGAHHPSDVLGGWAIGLAWAGLCRWVQIRWIARMDRRELPAANSAAATTK